MTRLLKRGVALAGCVAVAAALAACGSTSDSASGGSGSGETVAVDVGLDKPIELPTGELSVGIFMNAMTNQYQQNLANEAKKTAEGFGWSVKILDFNFDQQAMMNALQTAATNKAFDVVFVSPIDGVGACNMVTKTLPAANVLTVVNSQTVCDRDTKPLEEMWAPGTLSFVGITTGVDYNKLFMEEAAEAFPGPQKAAFVVGFPEGGSTKLYQSLAEDMKDEYPEFSIEDFIYTDFTTPSGFTATQNYLQANPDTTVLLSAYSPDLSQGIIQALDAQGALGDVKVADVGTAQYTVDQMKAGNIQMSMPLYPVLIGSTMVQAVKDAQDGKDPVRVPDYVPGEVDNAPVVTPENVDSFEPEF
jgi:ABC-type sugar transport system substrate-binding protein